jgi:hypothetical protein
VLSILKLLLQISSIVKAFSHGTFISIHNTAQNGETPKPTLQEELNTSFDIVTQPQRLSFTCLHGRFNPYHEEGLSPPAKKKNPSGLPTHPAIAFFAQVDPSPPPLAMVAFHP